MKNPFIQILKALADADIDFVLCGGVACVLQGCDRTTQDLDINIAMNRENIEKTLTVLNALHFHPRNPKPQEALLDPERRRFWREEKNALVYTLVSREGLIQVDLFLDYPIPWEDLKESADRITMSGATILVSSRKDLIRAKEAVKPPREKDLWDIRILRELMEKKEAIPKNTNS